MESERTKLYLEKYNKARKEGKVPKDWLVGVIIPIHKNEDVQNCKL